MADLHTKMGLNFFIFTNIFIKKCPHQRSTPSQNGSTSLPLWEILNPFLELDLKITLALLVLIPKVGNSKQIWYPTLSLINLININSPLPIPLLKLVKRRWPPHGATIFAGHWATPQTNFWIR